MIEKVVLGFGSNVGNRLGNILSALKDISLTKGFDLLAFSSVYETEPWGYKRQRKFLNSCAVFLCRLSPQDLLKTVKKTEKKIGRLNRGKWQAREIDIDVLFYGSRIINAGEPVIPHPFLQERNFVLKPLVELMPGFIHPKIKKSIEYIYSHSKDDCKVNKYIERK
jgi:dihydroneopterin aldolase / 2-amino-4-hydroxy-6-hydroxymethyldihydropteridine diphosphokinase